MRELTHTCRPLLASDCLVSQQGDVSSLTFCAHSLSRQTRYTQSGSATVQHIIDTVVTLVVSDQSEPKFSHSAHRYNADCDIASDRTARILTDAENRLFVALGSVYDGYA